MYRVIALALFVSVPAAAFAADPPKPVKAQPALYANVQPGDVAKQPTTIRVIKVGGTMEARVGTSPSPAAQPTSEEDRTRFMNYADIQAAGGHVQAF
jgi:hypothetical protein